MTDNGLILHEIISKTVPVPEISEIKETASKYFHSDGFVVAYLTNGVYIGRYRGGEFEFHDTVDLNPDYIVRLRIFSENEELYIWKTRDQLKGRLRIDTDREKTQVPVVDAYQVLWGTDKKELKAGWTRIFEDRGTELILPFSEITIDNKKKRLFLKTRNYIDFHPKTHLATYTDCRFVGFFDHNKNPLK